MKRLYAYDFDKTLIPYDSFRQYLWHLLKMRPVSVAGLLVLRKLRLISSAGMKRCITMMVERSDRLTQDAQRFAKRVVNDVQIPVATPKEGVALIISASPKIYMKSVAEAIGCELASSDWSEGKYVEMYGDTKALWLHEHYPQAEYEWMYAVSDSTSDECWMKEFKEYKLVDKR